MNLPNLITKFNAATFYPLYIAAYKVKERSLLFTSHEANPLKETPSIGSLIYSLFIVVQVTYQWPTSSRP